METEALLTFGQLLITAVGALTIPLHVPKGLIQSVSPKQELQWGAYVDADEVTLQDFEKRVGKPVDMQAVFVHWGNEREFPWDQVGILKTKTLVIFWEAKDYEKEGTEYPDYSYKAILRGDWDTYIRTFAEQVKGYGGPVILIPFEEMNGDWNPWSGTKNGNTPAEHIEAYRYIHKFFDSVPNVKFGWTVNSDSVPDTSANRVAAYYPGNAYVDYVGVDGFNFNDPWVTFDQIFGKTLRTLNRYKKPIIIFSMASAEGPKKSAWITDALTVQIPKYPLVTGFVWFNEKKERDWRVWSDAATLGAFTKALTRY